MEGGHLEPIREDTALSAHEDAVLLTGLAEEDLLVLGTAAEQPVEDRLERVRNVSTVSQQRKLRRRQAKKRRAKELRMSRGPQSDISSADFYASDLIADDVGEDLLQASGLSSFDEVDFSYSGSVWSQIQGWSTKRLERVKRVLTMYNDGRCLNGMTHFPAVEMVMAEDNCITSGVLEETMLRTSSRATPTSSAKTKFPELHELSLRRNQLTKVPAAVLLRHMPALRVLDLSNNHIVGAWPAKLVPLLPSLEALDLSHNLVSAIDALANCSSITQIDVSFNRLTQLGSLARLLPSLPGLERFNVTGNACGIPLGVAQRGLAALRRYFDDVVWSDQRDWERGQKRRNTKRAAVETGVDHATSKLAMAKWARHARVLVVGDPNAGKTSAVRSLTAMRASVTAASPPSRSPREETIGVDIHEWDAGLGRALFHIQDNGPVPIRFQLWDFAGQHQYHHLHSCFFDDKSLYLICASAAKGRSVEEVAESIVRWVNAVTLRAPRSVVILVLTHAIEAESAEEEFLMKQKCDLIVAEVFRREVFLRGTLRALAQTVGKSNRGLKAAGPAFLGSTTRIEVERMLRSRPANWNLDATDLNDWHAYDEAAWLLASQSIRDWTIYLSNHEAFTHPFAHTAAERLLGEPPMLVDLRLLVTKAIYGSAPSLTGRQRDARLFFPDLHQSMLPEPWEVLKLLCHRLLRMASGPRRKEEDLVGVSADECDIVVRYLMARPRWRADLAHPPPGLRGTARNAIEALCSDYLRKGGGMAGGVPVVKRAWVVATLDRLGFEEASVEEGLLHLTTTGEIFYQPARETLKSDRLIFLDPEKLLQLVRMVLRHDNVGEGDAARGMLRDDYVLSAVQRTLGSRDRAYRGSSARRIADFVLDILRDFNVITPLRGSGEDHAVSLAGGLLSGTSATSSRTPSRAGSGLDLDKPQLHRVQSASAAMDLMDMETESLGSSETPSRDSSTNRQGGGQRRKKRSARHRKANGKGKAPKGKGPSRMARAQAARRAEARKCDHEDRVPVWAAPCLASTPKPLGFNQYTVGLRMAAVYWSLLFEPHGGMFEQLAARICGLSSVVNPILTRGAIFWQAGPIAHVFVIEGRVLQLWAFTKKLHFAAKEESPLGTPSRVRPTASGRRKENALKRLNRALEAFVIEVEAVLKYFRGVLICDRAILCPRCLNCGKTFHNCWALGGPNSPVPPISVTSLRINESRGEKRVFCDNSCSLDMKNLPRFLRVRSFAGKGADEAGADPEAAGIFISSTDEDTLNEDFHEDAELVELRETNGGLRDMVRTAEERLWQLRQQAKFAQMTMDPQTLPATPAPSAKPPSPIPEEAEATENLSSPLLKQPAISMNAMTVANVHGAPAPPKEAEGNPTRFLAAGPYTRAELAIEVAAMRWGHDRQGLGIGPTCALRVPRASGGPLCWSGAFVTLDTEEWPHPRQGSDLDALRRRAASLELEADSLLLLTLLPHMPHVPHRIDVGLPCEDRGVNWCLRARCIALDMGAAPALSMLEIRVSENEGVMADMSDKIRCYPISLRWHPRDSIGFQGFGAAYGETANREGRIAAWHRCKGVITTPSGGGFKAAVEGQGRLSLGGPALNTVGGGLIGVFCRGQTPFFGAAEQGVAPVERDPLGVAFFKTLADVQAVLGDLQLARAAISTWGDNPHSSASASP